MFNKIQRKLTIQYAFFFLLFVVLLMAALYISISAIMQQQQVQELEQFFGKERYHLEKDDEDEDDVHDHNKDDQITDGMKIEYDANRSNFYYVFSKNNELVHGDESFYGLYKDVAQLMMHAKDEDPQTVEWKDQDLLLIKYDSPHSHNGSYMIIGQSVTKQHHLLERMMYAFIALTLIGTLCIAFLSHYLAGKAMVPIKKSFERQRKFVSDASHELRTPLSVFYSSLEVLENDDENEFGAFGQEVLTDLKNETQHMETLLEGLLFLARFDQNKLKTKKEDIELSKLVNSITKSFERTLPDSIQLKTQIADGIKFIGDETSIRELLYILLENATKFTEKGSIRVSLTSINNYIKLIVEDTGIGITQRDLPHVFDRFYQATKNRQKKGTGLGLSIAQAIVSHHQGHISVESEFGQGTKFIVSLPILKKD
ncbi:cell wall metabolism sensor histidine kinase WalK [Rummeliibacillus sp. TYF005]|uniref:sensor histidine kinase n=1 Tax=Rummeliibacillus sp. TYF005 TaxID=2058214 RepID=UPI0013DE2E8C|nr:HAMP domain-containing sensor histidine kinase [Rummeliibacillus sp. TYF005]